MHAGKGMSMQMFFNSYTKTFGVNSLTASVYIDWECLGLYVIDI